METRLNSLLGMSFNRGRNPNQPSQLGRNGVYSVFYGGIDSESVTLRSRDPVAIRASVVRRMANEVACIFVPQEFAIVDLAERRLLRDVDAGEVPVAADGTIDAAVETRVRAQIRRLHNVLWQEEDIDEVELDASYALFVAALQEMRAPEDGVATPAAIGGTCHANSKFVATADGVRPAFPATGTVVIDGVEHRRVTQDPTFTVRAWMAVVSAILADARFLFE
jgi:hypothetical protein